MSQITTETIDGRTVVHLNGQFIGGEQTDELRDKLKKLSEIQENRAVIDFNNVTYMNSTAIGVLISAHASFVKRDGRIVLCNVNKAIENIFVITKLTLVFTIKPSIEEAIESLK